MKRPITIVIVSAYVLFMALWFVARNRTTVEENAPGQGKVATAPKGGKTQSKSASFGPALAGTKAGNGKAAKKPATGNPVQAQQRANTHISPQEVGTFKPYVYPGGQPYYKGEPVTAFVRVPSTGQEVAMTVNQGGEYPRLVTKQGEKVQVRLAFTTAPPESPVAVAAQDGGKLEDGNKSMATLLDGTRQVAFAYTVSPNPGLHRVTIESTRGETKTLEFWAGPPMPVKKLK